MARLAGVEIPNDKQVQVSLCYIYGIGPSLARRILAQAGVQPGVKVKDLPEEDLNRIREVIDKGGFQVEADLRREVAVNIRRLIEVGSYRGLRHRRSLPVRGQRTRTNARTRRGPRKTVAGRRRVRAKK